MPIEPCDATLGAPSLGLGGAALAQGSLASFPLIIGGLAGGADDPGRSIDGFPADATAQLNTTFLRCS